jgi:PilZ domain
MEQDRRVHPRHRVHAGNCQITALSDHRPPRERARIVDFSRGGLLLKVHSPRRRFLILKQEAQVENREGVNCTLRLPPLYKDVKVQGVVVHVARVPQDEDWLHVGVQFTGGTQEKSLNALAQQIEPSPSARLEKPSQPAPQPPRVKQSRRAKSRWGAAARGCDRRQHQAS